MLPVLTPNLPNFHLLPSQRAYLSSLSLTCPSYLTPSLLSVSLTLPLQPHSTSPPTFVHYHIIFPFLLFLHLRFTPLSFPLSFFPFVTTLHLSFLFFTFISFHVPLSFSPVSFPLIPFPPVISFLPSSFPYTLFCPLFFSLFISIVQPQSVNFLSFLHSPYLPLLLSPVSLILFLSYFSSSHYQLSVLFFVFLSFLLPLSCFLLFLPSYLLPSPSQPLPR